MTTWGVYNIQGKDRHGNHVAPNDKAAVKWFTRWRVDGGTPRKATFKAKGHAATFHKRLLQAQVMGWPADDRGRPVDPMQQSAAPASRSDPDTPRLSFEDYCHTTWYPTAKVTWEDKNRLGHRRNMELAIAYLRYPPSDPRLNPRGGRQAGESILLADVVPDDVLRAIALRKTSNGRTAAINRRRTDAALSAGAQEVNLVPETSSPATVRAFYVTLAMILRAARASHHIPHDPLVGTSRQAPKPKQSRISHRVVPSVDEVFDLADVIAKLGPTATDGRPAGERFRSLILAAGTLGPRPGELTAHQSDWLDWDGEHLMVRFHRTEAAIYDPREGVKGRQVRSLKHRADDEWREVPALSAVADAIRLHLERGYGSPTRTWTSVSGRSLDWHNLMALYWRPACQKVFGGTAKNQLVNMTPNTLRKAAITFWLDSGISPYLAADWAGHSEDVARRYYAGRAAGSYAREVAILAAAQNHA